MNNLPPEQTGLVNNPDVQAQWAAALSSAQGQSSPNTIMPRQAPLVMRAGVLGICLAGGLAGGMTFQDQLHPPAPDEQPTTSYPSQPQVTETPDVLLGGVDTLIRAGCFQEALALCSTNTLTEHDETVRAFREGLCLEGLGRWQQAAEAYRRATNPQTSLDQWAWAMFAQARCALATGKRESASDLLHHIGERIRHQSHVNPRLLSECLYLQAKLLLLELNPASELDPFASDALAWPPLVGDVEYYLDWFEGNDGSREQEITTQIIQQAVMKAATTQHRAIPEVVAKLLRLAVFAAPDHPAERAMWVVLGNLDFQAGRFSDANRSYRRVHDRSGVTREAVYAVYNLGLLELRQWNFHAAQARFLEVIDRAPDSQWSDYGWWWIARSHLDMGETALALQPLQTALAGRTKAVTSAAALALCAHHLLDGNLMAVQSVLQKFRISTQESHTVLLELFESVLRYQIAPSELRAEAVLTGIHSAQDIRALGPLGVFLTGRIYCELGLHDHMVHLYDRESLRIQGPLAIRMTYEAARRFDQLDLRHEARQRYLAVTVMDPEGLGPIAQLRVADLAARDGRGVECVQRCRTLIDQPGIDRTEILAIMGHGYELQKKYRQAAECFAGRIPHE